MTAFEKLLGALAEAFDRAGIGYMVIGGQAVLIHGEPRQTRDIDVTLALDHDQAGRVMSVLSGAGLRFLPPQPADFARQTNVLPAEDSASGLRADVVFSDSAYERAALARAQSVVVAGRPVRFASAEDLVIHKLVAGRPVDLQDVRGIWLRKGTSLDLAYIESWLGQFAAVPGLEGVTDLWRQARRP